MAIRKALWEQEERATAAAYERQPDSATDAYLDAVAWEAPARAASPKAAIRVRTVTRGQPKRARRQ